VNRRLLLRGAAGACVAVSLVLAVALFLRAHARVAPRATAEIQLVGYAFGHVALFAGSRGEHLAVAPALPAFVAGTAGVAVRETGDGHALEELVIPPEYPAGPVELTVGQNSVRVAEPAQRTQRDHVAGNVIAGNDVAMAYSVLRDFNGNRVVDGTPIDFRITLPDGTRTTLTTETDGGIAWRWLPHGVRAGVAPVAAVSGGASSSERSLFVMPGRPMPTTLSVDYEVSADGRRLVTVRSGHVVDVAQNTLVDGYALTFRATTDGGVREARVPVVNGRVTWRVRAPTVAETVHFELYGDGRRLAETACTFAKGLHAATLVAFEAGPPRISRSADDTGVELPSRFTFSEEGHTARVSRPDEDTRDISPPRLRAGPFLGAMGQFVPDGTDAYAEVTDADGAEATLFGVVDHGDAVWTLPAAMTARLPLRVRFRVGGARPPERGATEQGAKGRTAHRSPASETAARKNPQDSWSCDDGRCGSAVVER
jgi:hypothetical protein